LQVAAWPVLYFLIKFAYFRKNLKPFGMETLVHRKQKLVTWSEFREMEIPEGDTSIYELINGEIVKRASPNSPHQSASVNLTLLFGLFIKKKKLGRFFHAPFDVYLDEYSAGIQPDLLFVSNERNFIIHPSNGIVGTPDLVVEIVSKGSVKNDRVTKKEVYQRFAVKEYWIVDVRSKTVEVYVMENDQYKLYSFAEEEGVIKSAVLTGFKLDVKEIFD
jgi:Uma2 family endonuclease